MSTPLENLEGLKRKITITIADDKIQGQLQPRLKQLAGQVQLKGFRPGKVPLKEVQRRFGREVRLEIIEKLVSEHFGDAVKEHDLKLAGAPELHPLNMDEGKDVSFDAIFEVQPTVELVPLKGAKLEKFDVTISDADLDKMVDRMRKQHAEWNDTDRAAKEGDKVVIDFDGTVEGKPLDGGQADNYELELGSKSMIEGFEAGLVGLKPGDEKELKLSFPKEYHHAEVAGKPVVFKIKVHKVREGVLPELDEHFAKKLKIKGGIEKLRDEVKENMQREADTRAKQQLKQELCEVLIDRYNIDVPNSMIDYEVEQMKKSMAQRMGLSQDQMRDFEAPIDYAKQAKDNVTLGLIFSAVIDQKQISANDDQIDAKLTEMAQPFSNPESIVQMYKSNEKMLEDIRAQVLEDLVVDTLLDDVELTTTAVDFEQFEQQMQKGS